MTGRERDPGRLRARCRSSTSALAARSRACCCAGSRREPPDAELRRLGAPDARRRLPLRSTLVGLTAYAVLGGADFGAGFWDLAAGGAERGAPVRGHAQRAMAPVWEANHVWLIFVLVVLWTAFPERVRLGHLDARRPAVPRRGRDHPARRRVRPARARRRTSARRARSARRSRCPRCSRRSSSARRSARSPRARCRSATPRATVVELDRRPAALRRRAGGRHRRVPRRRLPRRPTRERAGRARAGATRSAAGARRRASSAGALAIAGWLVVHADAPRALRRADLRRRARVRDRLGASPALVTLWLVWRERFEPARYTAAAAVAAIVAGWALAQEPDLLPPT